MRLTECEKRMLQGEYGQIRAKALDYLVQFGEAFGAEKLVDISYSHYPSEMAIYDGFCEDVEQYANQNIQVAVPTTSSTLCCDIDDPSLTNCPLNLSILQEKTKHAFQKMGILETFTCTPQQIGFVPPMGSYISSVESSAIIYFNSVLGARTNRGGLFTRYSSVTGKYPAMGYLLDQNRSPSCYCELTLSPNDLSRIDQWSILGYLIGEYAQDQVPFIRSSENPKPTLSQIVSLGAAMATSGSVTLFHWKGITPEANQHDTSRLKDLPYLHISKKEVMETRERFTAVQENHPIDFIVLGCPHATLSMIQYVAKKIEGKTIHENVAFWICTNRMTKLLSSHLGFTQTLERAGIRLIADTCPVESHMRSNICSRFSIPFPCYQTMASNSLKMLHYSKNLLGVKSVLLSTDQCIESAIVGKRVSMDWKKGDWNERI